MLEGLHIKEKVGEGSQAIVYRAVQKGQSYALKLPIRPIGLLGEETLLRFRREASLLARTNHPGLPRLFGLGEWEGQPALLQEYVEGLTLDRVLARGPLAVDRVVAICRVVAGALHELHRQGLVHRDVKPQNVVIEPNGGVRLIDFGLLVPAYHFQAGESFAGTLQYSAPEQVGMLHRPLDGRTDLYALGVLLYQMSTGQLPYRADSPAELARLHVAVVPPPVRQLNPELSPALEAIITKLMAKEPDDRYQTGIGLIDDLERLAELEQALSTGEPIRLGRLDQPIGLFDEVACVGREREMATLQTAWHKALTGSGQLLLIEGEPGSGKSRLMREFLSQIDVERGLAAKCVEGDPVPFAALREALREQVRRWEALPVAQREEAQARFWSDSSLYGPMLRRFMAIGSAEILEDEDRTSSYQRTELLLDGLATTLQQLATQREGLVLFVDDLQWVDDATAGVLRRLISRLEGLPLLVVLAMRNNQTGSLPTARLALANEQLRAERINLEPLSDDAVVQLIARHLGGRAVEPALVQRVLLHTGSNPFAVGEYLRTLVEGGLLWPHLSGWRVEEEALDHLELPGGVVALIRRRFEALQPATIKLLSAAALLGKRFTIDVLLQLQLAEAEQVYQAMVEAVVARLIMRLGGGRYGFAHDRVREALYAYLSERERRALHQRIAEMLDLEEELEPEQIYARAHHYALGERQKDPERQYEALFAAGLTAMRDYADEEAYGYLIRAQAVALEFGLRSNGMVEESLGVVAILTGRLLEGQRHLEAALPYRHLPVNRAEIHVHLARIHLWNMDIPSAWKALEDGFAALGLRMDRPRLTNLVVALSVGLGSSLLRRLGLRRPPTSAVQHRRLQVLLHLYEQVTEAALFEGGSPLMVLLTMLRAVQHGGELGPSSESAIAITNAGFILGNMGAMLRMKWLTRRSQRAFREAGEMAKGLRDRHVTARVLHLEALCYTFMGEVALSEAQHRRYLHTHGSWLRTADYLNGASDLVWSLLMRGYFREGWEWTQVALRRVEAAGAANLPMRIHWWTHAYAGPTLAALGHPTHGETHLLQIQGILGQNRSSWEIYLSMRLLFLLEKGELGDEMEQVITRFYAEGLHPKRPVPHHQRFYIYHGYARWTQWRVASETERPERLTQLAFAVKELGRVGPQPILQAHVQLLSAAFHWASGQEAVAEGHLIQAESQAERSDSPWVQFECLRLRAYMAERAGQQAQARRYLRLALSLAVDHGWAGRVTQLRSELGLAGVELVEWQPSWSAAGVSLRDQRHLDVLLQVSLAAAESLESGVQARAILREIVRILGAERAFLFLITDGAADLQYVMGLGANGEELTELSGHSRTVVERVAMRRAPLVVRGTEEAAALGSASIIAHDLRSIIAAPLLQRDRLVGVVYVDNRLARGIFSQEDEQILLALANHIAIALEAAKLTQLQVEVEGERRLRLLAESLRHLTQALSASLSVREVVDRFLDRLPELLPYEHASVLMLETDSFRSLLPGVAPQESDLIPLDQHPPLLEVVRTTRPVLLSNAMAASLPVAPLAEVGAWLGVPLTFEGEVIGLIALWASRIGGLGERELEIAYTLAGPVAIALARAKLFEEVKRAAVTDELTGIANRRYLMQTGEQEWARARGQEEPLAVLMLDVDHFKNVNDQYGHMVGDQVLRAVVLRCQRHLREVDLMGRYGGEEFAVLLPGASLEQAIQVAERLRRTVCLDPVMTDAGPITVSISVGVALLDGSMQELRELFHQGDLALYMAKEAGRNRVMVAPGAI